MALSCHWPTKVITVPQSDLTLVSGTHYQIDVLYWFQLLRELQGSAQGIAETINASLYNNTPPTSSTPRIVDVVNGYTCQMQIADYTAEFINGNCNWREVEIKNSVGVGTNNTTGFINPVFLEHGTFDSGGGVTLDFTYGALGTDGTKGNAAQPVKLLSDALIILGDRGLDTLFIKGPYDFSDTDDVSHLKLIQLLGANSENILTFADGCQTEHTSVYRAAIQGTFIGEHIHIEYCLVIGDIHGVNGCMQNCMYVGDVYAAVDADIACTNGRDAIVGAGAPTFYGSGAATLNIEWLVGGLNLEDVTDGHVSLESQGSNVVVQVSCTGGSIGVHGACRLYDYTPTGHVFDHTLTTETTAEAVMATDIDGYAFGQVMKIVSAVITGLLSGVDDDQEENVLEFKGLDGIKTRATVTNDATGRTQVIFDVS